MPYLRKLPSGKWQATVRHPSGRRFTRTDPLRKTVALWASDLETQIRRGEFVDPTAGRIRLSSWWEDWLRTRVLEDATVAKYQSVWRTHVEPAFGSWPLSSIQSWDVEKWIADLAGRGVGAEVAATSVRLLKQLLADAVRHRLLSSNPCDVVQTPKVPRHLDRWLTGEEPDQLLDAISMPDRSASKKQGEPWPRVPDPLNRLLVQLMLDAGLRWQESAGLQAHRVELRRQRLMVREVAIRGRRLKSIPKSAASQRVVPLTDSLTGQLERLMWGREGVLFDGDGSGRPMDYANWLKRVWNRSLQDAGLADPQPTPHDCRHTYGSWLAEQGVPPHEIAALMGHGSLRAVERYVHASEARLERARRAVDARVTHRGGVMSRDPGPLGEEPGSDLR